MLVVVFRVQELTDGISVHAPWPVTIVQALDACPSIVNNAPQAPSP